MASELRVNTLKDAAGSNEVAMTYVANGSAKAWVNFDFDGTQAITKSFNTASITDDGTGASSIALAAAMSDANYIITCNGVHDGSLYVAGLCVRHDTPPTSSVLKLDGMNYNQSNYDMEMAMGTVHGDLA
jgi:hypothetical protein